MFGGGSVSGVCGRSEGYTVGEGGLYSPISGVAGPLTSCPGTAGFQLSTHAHVCTEEKPINL